MKRCSLLPQVPRGRQATFYDGELIEYCPDAEFHMWLRGIATTRNVIILFFFAWAFIWGVFSGTIDRAFPVFETLYRIFLFPLIDLLKAGTGAGSGGNVLGLITQILTSVYTGALLFAAVAYLTVRYSAAATHIGINSAGLSVLYRGETRDRYFVSCYVSWEEILRVSVDRPSGKRSAKDCRLRFQVRGNDQYTLRVGDIYKPNQRGVLLQALRQWLAPECIDDEVFDVLEPPAIQQSYTELWLKQVAAPPVRHKLARHASGTVLNGGAYRIERQIGMGGQGTVYLATVLDGRSIAEPGVREAALKEYILPVFPDADVRRRAAEKFEHETRVLSRLNHPQIVKLLDVFVEDHRAYLVLERAKGCTLQDLVAANGPLSEDLVTKLAVQMCDILEYLHSEEPPVIHRDFTPDNLMLQPDGMLKLIDFSVAQERVSGITGTIVGKHNYMSPEQFRGKPTRQSDIYSLGATLSYLLTGQFPEPISELHPRAANPSISETLDETVAKCTALDCEDRYKSVAELKDDLAVPPGDTIVETIKIIEMS